MELIAAEQHQQLVEQIPEIISKSKEEEKTHRPVKPIFDQQSLYGFADFNFRSGSILTKFSLGNNGGIFLIGSHQVVNSTAVQLVIILRGFSFFL